MSKIALTGNASGTGTLTIAAPNTSTDRTLTLPDESGELFLNANGAIDVNASAPADSVAIDASGNVGIGTSSPGGRLEVAGAADGDNVIRASANSSNGLVILRPDGANGNALRWGGNGANANIMRFVSGGDAERARIDSSGNLLVGTTSATLGALGNFVKSNATNYMMYVENSGNNSSDKTFRSVLGSNCNGTSAYHFVAHTGGNDRLYIYGNGNVVNSNNSYGGLSDVKIKENITDATPKLEKLQQVRVVNYNLIGDDQKQVGVIAQELEQIFPSMVEETADRDAEGNDLGTTTKSVKYSVFVPMLIKAIQEQQALIQAQQATIDSLETRIAALEAA